MNANKNPQPRRTPPQMRNVRRRPEKNGGTSKFSGLDWSKGGIWAVLALFGLGWGLLWIKMFSIQIIEGPRYAKMAERQYLAAETISGRRGSILDRNGNILARSVECRSVAVNPALVKDSAATANFLASALGRPVKQVRDLLDEKKNFVWIARKIDDRVAADIGKAKMPGVQLVTEYERVYPYKQLAGQLLGFVGVDDKGLEGLEASLEESLRPRKSRKVVARDARGRLLYLDGEETAGDDMAGEDVFLTLDIQMQFFAEEALAEAVEKWGGKWGGCIVVDVPTGEVLAWAQYPFFNPNAYKSYPPFVARNKLVTDAVEHGSTVKSFLVASVLEEKIADKNTVINCENGKWKLHNVTIRDTHPYSKLNLTEILTHSSNIGSGKLGLKLGAQRYRSYLSRLGFGAKTNLPVPGENKGIFRDIKAWQDVNLASASFGQGFSATSAQMTQAFLTLAGNGEKRSLKLILDKNPAGQDNTAAPERIYSEATVRQLREMMRGVVDEQGGTGGQARIPGLSVGGKTGTAQKADASGKYGSKRVASFVGMVPIEEPRYLVYTIVDEPVNSPYGGVVAAPVFHHVALRAMAYHGYLPDPEDPVLAAVAAAGKQKADAKIKAEVAAKAKAREKAQAQAQARAEQASKSGQGEVRGEVADEEFKNQDSGRVPSVLGLGARKAVETFALRGLVPNIRGQGDKVVRQSPEAGSPWPADPKAVECTIWLEDKPS